MKIKSDKGARRLINAILVDASRDAIKRPTKSRPYDRDKAMAFFKSQWGRLLIDNSAIKEYTTEQIIRKLQERMQ